jgi:probable HAF family extracellular repeat protein
LHDRITDFAYDHGVVYVTMSSKARGEYSVRLNRDKATDLSNDGHAVAISQRYVVGRGVDNDSLAAIRWTHDGRSEVLRRGSSTRFPAAVGVSSNGDVCGVDEDPNGVRAPWIIYKGELSMLNVRGTFFSRPLAVNRNGVVVGQIFLDGKVTAAIWKGNTITTIPELAQSSDSELAAINDRGDMAGIFETASARSHAFVFRNGKFKDITPDAKHINNVVLSRTGEVFACDDDVWHYSNGTTRKITNIFGIEGPVRNIALTHVDLRGTVSGLLLEGSKTVGFTLKRK